MMKDLSRSELSNVPVLVPIPADQFWKEIRAIVREELIHHKKQFNSLKDIETPGMTYKPLFKIAEVCNLFNITKPTIYDWIKHGKLKPVKIRSRVYFLWQDVQNLMQHSAVEPV